MAFLFDEHQALLIKLLEARVDFILIGDYAGNFHGYNRPTGNMNIWLRPDNENKKKLLALLKIEGYRDAGLNALKKLDFSKANAFHIGHPPLRADFLTMVSGVEFDDAWKAKVFLPLEKYFVPVLNLNHLILSKIGNKRTRGKADVEELQKISQVKRKPKMKN